MNRQKKLHSSTLPLVFHQNTVDVLHVTKRPQLGSYIQSLTSQFYVFALMYFFPNLHKKYIIRFVNINLTF